jgi:hypothetical protein
MFSFESEVLLTPKAIDEASKFNTKLSFLGAFQLLFSSDLIIVIVAIVCQNHELFTNMFEHLFVVVDWRHGTFLSVAGGDSRQWTQITHSAVSHNLVAICHVLRDFHDWQTNYLFARVVMFFIFPPMFIILLTVLFFFFPVEAFFWPYSSLHTPVLSRVYWELLVSGLCVWSSLQHSVHTMAGCERWWCFCLFCIAWFLLKYDCTLLMF